MPAPILIVEDDTDINNMMAEALTKAGYACTQAFSGTEGLLYLDQGPYALVILDLMLPGLEGEALLPQIKAKTGTPVLVVSAKDSLDSKVGLLTAGAEDYLTKPFAIQELVARALQRPDPHPGDLFRHLPGPAGGADPAGVSDLGAPPLPPGAGVLQAGHLRLRLGGDVPGGG